jgi:hypothetical protein
MYREVSVIEVRELLRAWLSSVAIAGSRKVDFSSSSENQCCL